MKIVELKYKQFTFPLKNQLNNSKQTIQSKDAIILKAIDSSGENYFGEVPPLYGFSKETILDCKDVLDNFIQDKILLKNVSEIKTDLLPKIKLPSLLFGLESILFQMENKQIFQFIKSRIIKNNALIGIDNDANNLEKIQHFIKSGFNTIKLKVGSDFDKELNLIKFIKQRFASSIKLRLDANGSWNYDDALKNIHNLEKYNIQYIEQPVNDKNELIELAKKIQMNLAPDESIKNIKDAEEYINLGNFNFIVLKPSIRMGVYETIKIIELANENNINVIITSAYETVVGKAMLLYLASLTNHNFAHGLNTETLGVEIFDSSINYNLPKINLDQDLFTYQIND
ncbi:MAG: o-succinylbenzoate synthase, partial [Ignavibacteriae bacterium]|nr:o-succinylbenzoate synthase [Ignavibacteriota bacterium]